MVINMWIYSWQEIVWMTAAAIALDWLIGDPKWPTHPVIHHRTLDSLGRRQIT